MEESTRYKVTLSYPGVTPVQYDIFLEEETPSLHSSVHERRIQDTRLFSFETNKYGEIVKSIVTEEGATSTVVELVGSEE